MVEVLLLPLRRPRLVRDLVAVDDTEISGHPAGGAERHDRRGEDRHSSYTPGWATIGRAV